MQSNHPEAALQPARIGLAELTLALHAADPSAILVPPRILRRVIKQNARIHGLGLRVPHRKTYVVTRAELLSIVEPAELDLPAGFELPNNVILIARPTLEKLAALTPEEALTKYWRLLFHARVHIALDEPVVEGRLGPAVLQQRIAQIGQTEFDEIRAVLRQEDYLLPPKNDLSTYIEFAAVYLELRYFAESFLKVYFPGIHDFARIDELLRQDIDAEELFQMTRLQGAPCPPVKRDVSADEDLPGLEAELIAAPALDYSERHYRKLSNKAERAASLGNAARAAIYRTRAARYGGPELAERARAEARNDLDRLTRRLQRALGFADAEAADWLQSMIALIDLASRGIWTPEARLLYDLQKVCVDHERGVYRFELIRWARSLGREPLRRPLPGQRDVLMSKHLRGAAGRLSAVRLSGRARIRLSSLLHSAVHRAEGNLRAKFRPMIEQALDEVRLVPQNVPERVAREKLIDELVDRIVERGFLVMGDLRDALSRNNLKLPDVQNISQAVGGDQLLQADRRLAAKLDGVYRPGEIYLRLPQALSSVAFGTPWGRFLTRYVALPFGGAFLALEGLHHMFVPLATMAGYEAWHIRTHLSVFLLGVFLLGLLHHHGFRMFCLEVLRKTGALLRLAIVELPSRLVRLPLVQAVLYSRYFQFVLRYGLKPLVISLVLLAALTLVLGRETRLQTGVGIFVVVNLLLNSRIGRNVDEVITDWMVHTWHRVRIHVFAALFRMIVDVFNRLLETTERLLYAVDEWLRFRAGENIVTTMSKAVLGVIWAVVHYIVRIYINLLIEPQVNPIKHFPVVTVSHKIILPFSLQLTALFAAPLMPLGQFLSNTIAGATVFLLPGVFGFLVWELKENWRLFAANRSKNLRPVIIGHHGETMIRFLRPGFHSGTVPKTYAKLRRGYRKAHATGQWKTARKHLENLHRVEEHLRWFVDRELLVLLKLSRGWTMDNITTGEIHLATNRILVEIYCPELSEDSLWLAFEEQSGWLLAGVYRRGWLDLLSDQQRHTLANAMAGFYKMAGVDLVREQLELRLPPGTVDYDIADEGLLVWNGRTDGPSEIYRLREWTASDRPKSGAGAAAPFATIDRSQFIFAATPITWRRWIVVWDLDQLNAGARHSILDDQCLLLDGLTRS